MSLANLSGTLIFFYFDVLIQESFSEVLAHPSTLPGSEMAASETESTFVLLKPTSYLQYSNQTKRLLIGGINQSGAPENTFFLPSLSLNDLCS